MNLLAAAVSMLALSFVAAPSFAQACDPTNEARFPGRPVEAAPPGTSVSLSAYGNPCAPYAWCGPRDAWGNPVYAAPAYSPSAGTYGYPYVVVLEPLEPHVNGWTGAAEYRPANPYGALIAY